MVNTLWSNVGVDSALNGVTAAWCSLHTASPGATGASEVSGGSYARVQTTWGSASGSSRAGSAVTISVPASTTITYFGVWDSPSGGNYTGGGQLSSPETFGAAGTYALTPSLSGSG